MKMLFVVGAPRSGTTWLQLLLAQHPRIVSSSETHIYTQYLKALESRWAHEQRRTALGYKVSGLTRVVDESEFYEATGAFAAHIYGTIARRRQGDVVVLDKTPENMLHAEHIRKHFPNAYFIHIIRDPRAVVASFKSAYRSWWSWTDSGAISICDRWQRDVVAGRAIGQTTARYREVFYEDLLDDGPNVLTGLFEFIGEPVDAGSSREIYDRCSIENLQSSSAAVVQPWDIASEPKSFFRQGTSEAWRDELSAYAIYVVEKRLAKQMQALRYEPMETSEGRDVPMLALQYSLARGLRRSLAAFTRLVRTAKGKLPLGSYVRRL